jgi:hypothetical protein
MSKAGTKTKSSSMPVVPGWAQTGLQNTFNQAQNTLGQSFVGNNPLVAGANEDITNSWDMARQAAQGQQGTLAQQQDIFGSLQNYGNATQDSVLQQRLSDIANLTNRNLNENIMPGIRTGAVQAGQAGSSRQGIAEGIAARGALEQTARSQTDLLANAEAQRLSALQAAGQMGGNLLQQQMAPATTIGAIGAQQRDIEQQKMQEGLMRQDAELQRLTGLGNIQTQVTNPFIGQSGMTNTPNQSWKTGDWAQAALGGGMAMFSDAALKMDVQDTGKHVAGVAVKSWKWKPEASHLGLVGHSSGVLAQDVAAKHPDCVLHNLKGSGYMGVDYSKLASKE